MSEYVTKSGVRLEVGRIPRQEIDAFTVAHPSPEPPTRRAVAFGDVEEDVPVWDAPEYQAKLFDYYVSLAHDQMALVAGAVEILDTPDLSSELAELREIGLAQGDGHADLLRYVILGNDEDAAAVTGLVMYHSTVTERGIKEAKKAFCVTWAGQPVETWRVPGTPGRYGSLFEARLAAKFSTYSWPVFCELSGPEQSAEVAFYRLSSRLDWLRSQK